jgi:hypothetical protein
MRSKLYALSLSILCGATLGLVAVSGGCSSSDNGGGDDDTGVAVTDTGAADTAPVVDAKKDSHDGGGTDTGPYSCLAPLPADFACTAPKITAVPGTSCSEDDLQGFATACIDKNFSVGSGCAAWMSAHTACGACIKGFGFATSSGGLPVYPDRDQCYYTKFSADCAKSWNCMFACDDAACNSTDTPCDKTAGSGTKGGSDSEFQDCVTKERARGGTAVPKGECYDVATKAALETCLPTLPSSALNFCVVNEEFSPTGPGGAPDLPSMRFEVIEYYRGACRDNGDWTNADQPCSTPPCETGTDAGSETGSDATSDATEGGSDAGTDADDGAVLPDVGLDTALDVALDTSLD